jgi:urease accessory protein
VQFRHQRADGAAIVTIGRSRAGTSELRDLYQRAPCRVLFPQVAADEPLQAVLLTTSGGLTGGDRTRVELNVEAGARATLTTQAAEKLYRALSGAPAVECAVTLRVQANAWSEWLAQETILFDGARLRRSFSADLAPGARLLAVESVVFGRKAMGEETRTGMLHDSWRIRCGGRLAWADALHLEDIGDQRRMPFGFGDAQAYATLILAAPEATGLLETVRSLLADTPAHAGATLLGELLVVRMLDADPARLRARIIAVAGLIRHQAGVAEGLPRVWHC